MTIQLYDVAAVISECRHSFVQRPEIKAAPADRQTITVVIMIADMAVDDIAAKSIHIIKGICTAAVCLL